MHDESHTKTICTKQGFVISYDDRDQSVGRNLTDNGAHEPATCAILQRYLQYGMNALVAGSNYGIFDCLIAREIGSPGKLWSFEANPALLSYRQQNLRQNGAKCACVLETMAIYSRSGTVELHCEPDGINLGGSSIKDEPHKTGTFTVPCVSLDDYFGSDLPSLDLVKLDIEGAEADAIDGMARLLREAPPRALVLEITAPDSERLCDRLEQLIAGGYRIRRIEDNAHPRLDDVRDVSDLVGANAELFLSYRGFGDDL